MIELEPEAIAAEARCRVVARGGDGYPRTVAVDSRLAGPGDLFVGLPGERADGGEFAAEALAAGAWGAIVSERHAAALDGAGAWVLVAERPLRAMQRLARGWRRRLGCAVVGVTGSTGKTSTRDILRAILPWRVHASPENYNTEIGLPLTILSAPADTQVLICEMAMRGLGQIAELSEIAEPDVAVIANVGPVHLELLGTMEAIAAAKSEILAGLGESGAAVIPADAEALEPHLGASRRTIAFGPGGEVFALESRVEGGETVARIATPDGEASFRFPFPEAHNLRNALAAIAAGVALGAPPRQMAARAGGVRLSRLRGELVRLAGGATVINDCYNANPTSMRAALDHLAAWAPGRKVAVLGDMAELGPEAEAYHREAGAHAREVGVALLVGVGELAPLYAPDRHAPDPAAAAELLGPLLEPGDTVLVKGSRAVGLEALSAALADAP